MKLEVDSVTQCQLNHLKQQLLRWKLNRFDKNCLKLQLHLRRNEENIAKDLMKYRLKLMKCQRILKVGKEKTKS